MNCLLAPRSGDDCCPVPQHLMGFILGMWFLTQAAAFLLGGYVATFTAVPDNITDPLETLPVYTNVFGKIGPLRWALRW